MRAEKNKSLLFLYTSTLIRIYVPKFLIKTQQKENGSA